MRETTARHNWCERCTNGTAHETTEGNNVHLGNIVRVSGITGQAAIEVSYVDGDRDPQIYVGSGADFTPNQLTELINVLNEIRLIVLSVQPAPALAVA